MQAVVALVVASTALQLLTLAAALHAIRGRWIDFLRPLMRPALCSLMMAGAIHLLAPALQDLSAVVRLVLLSLVGAVTYPVLSLVLNRPATMELVNLVLKRGR